MNGKEGKTQVQDMDAVYRQHAQTVFKYLMLLTHDADLAEELTQETFYQAVRSIDRFEVMQQVGQMELLKKLHVFPEPGRKVLYLRMFGNLSFREIGEVMGKTENWARVTFFRARTNLRKTNY